MVMAFLFFDYPVMSLYTLNLWTELNFSKLKQKAVYLNEKRTSRKIARAKALGRSVLDVLRQLLKG